jgi:glycosyltransferase involved in cell wall biosynthesis
VTGDRLQRNPKVSFIVPCYKLAHLLPDCIHSILSQTYGDFEILVMDDCSPDRTAEVAQSFKDLRVIHVRNQTNLGHLRNYNEGIRRARGEYVWLISADDRLRKDGALARYVQVMEAHPVVGFVFCPAVGLQHGEETGLIEWTSNGNQDGIIDGRRFLSELIHENSISAPAVMVRKRCYDQLGAFPLDLPYAGDWYLWCLFALNYDVAYCSEPVVSYRLHGLSMTNQLTRRHRVNDNFAVRWRVKRLAELKGYAPVVEECRTSLARHYTYCIANGVLGGSTYSLTFEEFGESLVANAGSPEEQKAIRACVYAGLADHYYHRRDFVAAMRFYRLALDHERNMPAVWAKLSMLRMGVVGAFVRDCLSGRSTSRSVET